MRRMVSLSGLRARVEQVGTMSHSSFMYVVILLRRRLSISQWLSLEVMVEVVLAGGGGVVGDGLVVGGDLVEM